MLTGAPPRPGATIGTADFDNQLSAIVDGLLVVDPQGREADAVGLGDELAQIAERLREKRLGF
jgi:hypothetical protein